MIKYALPLSFFLLMLTLLSCNETPPESTTLDHIQIVRDQWGVPHIIAPTDADVAYGLAWVQCEDDFNTLQEQMLAIKGMLGEVKGQKGIVVDFGVKFMGLREIVEERYDQDISPDFKKVLQSFVDGANAYAALHPEDILVKGMFPLRGQDLIMGYLLGMVDVSGAGKDLQRIMNGTIKNDIPNRNKQVKNSPPSKNADKHLQQIMHNSANSPPLEGTKGRSKGSNAIAISRNKTTDNKTYLAINSHQPLEGWYSWYEAHLISDEGMNILGGTFPGGVTIFHGANENLGWAHTVNHADFSDVYQLTMNPDNDLQYRFDGEWLTLETTRYWSWLKLWKFIKIPIRKTIYQSKYGPTFETEDGFFSWRYTVNLDIRVAEQWYRMNKAKNLADFKKALEMQGIPSTNIVYADQEDNIFYISNGRIPVRNPEYDWQKVLQGDTSATLWQTKYYPIDSLPQVLNPSSGYVFNTNNTPFSSSDSLNNPPETSLNKLLGYLPSHAENNRSARFLELITQYDRLSYEDFKRIKFDQQYPSPLSHPKMKNLELLLQLDAAKHPQIADAIQLLQSWDRKNNKENTTAPLFILSLNNLIDSLKAVDVYRIGNLITEAQCVAAIEKAVEELKADYQKIEVPLGTLQRHIRGEVNIPLGGAPDVLGAMYSKKQDNNQYKGVAGESYIELVRFSENGGVEIESINTYGTSAKPNRPHHTDQMKPFAEQRLKKMTLDKERVLAEADTIYVALEVL
ncbi:MAG: penicillin acylase family protein [Chitinophagales bacterium]